MSWYGNVTVVTEIPALINTPISENFSLTEMLLPSIIAHVVFVLLYLIIYFFNKKQDYYYIDEQMHKNILLWIIIIVFIDLLLFFLNYVDFDKLINYFFSFI